MYIKINNTFINNAAGLNHVIPRYNLIDYGNIYFMTLGSVQNYYRDQANNDAKENKDAGSYGTNKQKTTSSKPFDYKTKIIGNAPARNNELDREEVVVLLKCFSNFWRFLDLLLINCKVEFDLSQLKKSIISEILKKDAEAANPNANLPV